MSTATFDFAPLLRPNLPPAAVKYAGFPPFYAQNGGNPAGLNVRFLTETGLTALSLPVPEPGVWALMLVGVGFVGGALRAWGFCEGGAEEDLSGFFVECMPTDEVAGEIVVVAVADDEFNFVIFGEGFEVFEAEGVGCGACSGAFYVDDLVDGFGDVGQRALAAGLDHQGEVLGEEAVHEGEELFGLQHGLAAGELDEGAGGEDFDLLLDFVEGEGLASGEGVLGVAPGTAEVAAGEADEDAREASEGGFALDGFVEFDQMHLQVPDAMNKSGCV